VPDRKLNICEEKPIKMIVNDKELVTFMCTPNSLKELALGYLYNRNLISGINDILVLRSCDDRDVISVMTNNDLAEKEYNLIDVLASGCGSGSIREKKMQQLPFIEPEPGFNFSLLYLHEMTKNMFAEAELYQKTGGVHCAAMINQQDKLLQREDIGRHNAVDKIVGAGLMAGIDLRKTAILTTGRLSSDMLLKAVSARVPVVVSRSIPSDLALEIAENAGITIVGRAVSSSPIVYSHSVRITDH